MKNRQESLAFLRQSYAVALSCEAKESLQEFTVESTSFLP